MNAQSIQLPKKHQAAMQLQEIWNHISLLQHFHVYFSFVTSAWFYIKVIAVRVFSGVSWFITKDAQDSCILVTHSNLIKAPQSVTSGRVFPAGKHPKEKRTKSSKSWNVCFLSVKLGSRNIFCVFPKKWRVWFLDHFFWGFFLANIKWRHSRFPPISWDLVAFCHFCQALLMRFGGVPWLRLKMWSLMTGRSRWRIPSFFKVWSSPFSKGSWTFPQICF